MKLRILGAGGHAKVALDTWRSTGGDVIAMHDDDVARLGSCVLGVPVTGLIDEGVQAGDPLHIAIGDNRVRAAIATRVPDKRFPLVAHTGAWISSTANLSAGVLVCAGAVVQAEARVGRHVIVNSQALVEHDVSVGDFTHIAPGARLGGAVCIGEGVLIGIGAVVLPGVSVGDRAVIGGGAVVIRDVAEGAIVVGNPAGPLAAR